MRYFVSHKKAITETTYSNMLGVPGTKGLIVKLKHCSSPRGTVAETLQVSERRQAAGPETTKAHSPRQGTPKWSTGHEGQQALGREPHGG